MERPSAPCASRVGVGVPPLRVLSALAVIGQTVTITESLGRCDDCLRVQNSVPLSHADLVRNADEAGRPLQDRRHDKCRERGTVHGFTRAGPSRSASGNYCSGSGLVVMVTDSASWLANDVRSLTPS